MRLIFYVMVGSLIFSVSCLKNANSIDESKIKKGAVLFEFRDTERRNPFEGDTIVIDDIKLDHVKYHKLHVDDKIRTKRLETFKHSVISL